LPTLSLIGGIDASYSVAAGQTAVTIRSDSRLNYKAIYFGSGQMMFHWVQEGKTQVWKCDTSMADAKPAQALETTGKDGSQNLEVNLGTIYPAGLVLHGRMEGLLAAPAVHVQLPWWKDVWVFLIRSPWFPLRHQVDRSLLSVKHDTGEVTASIGVAADGSASGQVAFNGTDFKNATLVLRRKLGSYTSDEPVCEATPGMQVFSWKPILRIFDLVLVSGGHISESQLADLAKGLGAEETSGFLGPGSVQGDFVLCDGPAFDYSWVLKGHRGLLENAEDATGARFTW
jgi:hypothetical protein